MNSHPNSHKESNYDLAIPSASAATDFQDLSTSRPDGNSYQKNFESYMSHFDNYVSRQQMLKSYSPGLTALPQLGDIPKSNYSLQTAPLQDDTFGQHGNCSGGLIAFKPSCASSGTLLDDGGWYSSFNNFNGSLGSASAASTATSASAPPTSSATVTAAAAAPTTVTSGINSGLVENAAIGHNISSPGLTFDNGAYDTNSVKLTDFVRLTEAIQELICRLPRPPTEELLRNLEPKLAFTLHMTYLKAYIYNQQLLQEIKTSFIGMFASGGATDANKGTMRNFYTPNAITNVSTSASLPMVGYDYNAYNGNNASASFGGGASNMSNSNNSSNNYSFLGNNTASISSTSGAIPLQDSSCYIPNYGYYMNQPYTPPLASRAYDQMPLSLGMEPSNDETADGANLAIDPKMDTMISDRDHPATAIPQDLRATVKYDARKHAYVAVMVGPLGGRRRRAFSIRKFGGDRALKLATKYAISSGAKVANKERGLFEHVCEYALSLNPYSGKRLDYIKEAQALPETRGVVFSCGAQAWLAITYDASATRYIKGFTVQEHGFYEAHAKALQHITKAIQQEGLVASKMSGILCFWLERDERNNKVLCVLLQAAEMRKSTGQENYIGRFPLAGNSSFNATKLLAHKWRTQLKKQTFEHYDAGDAPFNYEEQEVDVDDDDEEDADADAEHVHGGEEEEEEEEEEKVYYRNLRSSTSRRR